MCGSSAVAMTRLMNIHRDWCAGRSSATCSTSRIRSRPVYCTRRQPSLTACAGMSSGRCTSNWRRAIVACWESPCTGTDGTLVTLTTTPSPIRAERLQAYRDARDKGLAWLLRHVNDDGSIGDPSQGFHFYRAPWTFVVTGQTHAAGRRHHRRPIPRVRRRLRLSRRDIDHRRTPRSSIRPQLRTAAHPVELAGPGFRRLRLRPHPGPSNERPHGHPVHVWQWIRVPPDGPTRRGQARVRIPRASVRSAARVAGPLLLYVVTQPAGANHLVPA